MFTIQIFELWGSILLKDSGVESHLDNIDKKGQSTSKSMGLSFGNIGKAALVAGAAIVTGLGAALVSGMKDAADAEAKVAQLEAVLKSTGGAAGMTKDNLIKLAEGFEKTTKFSAEAALEAESLLLTFTNIGKETFPRATKAAGDMATALGGDMAGQSIALGKALNDPIKGITALTRVGVTFTDEQKKSIKAMQEHGDMAGAQTIILKELEKEFGGSAEAAGKTFAGKLEILKNSIGAVTESMATGIMPYLSSFIKTIQDNMPKIQQTITDVINVIVPKFQEWMKLIGQIVSELFPNFGKETDGVKDKVNGFKVVLDIITGVLTFAKDNINLVKAALVALGVIWVIQTATVIAHNAALFIHNAQATIAAVRTGALAIAHGVHSATLGIATAAQWLFNAAMNANPIGLVILALAALGAGIYEVVKHWKEICEWVGKAWDWLTKWNGTPAKDKKSTVTTSYVRAGGNDGYASGTNYATPGAHWVGENGPEIVNFRGGESVLNAKDSAKVSGGLTLTIGTFINNRKEDIQELMEEIDLYRKQKDTGTGGIT